MPLGAERLLDQPAPPPPPTDAHDLRYVQSTPPVAAESTSQAVADVLAAGENAVTQYIAAPGSSLADKLTSRKLWAAIFGVALSILFAALGAIPHSEALKTGGTLGVVYIAAEGLCDALGALGIGG